MQILPGNKGTGRRKMYKLGCYNADGSLECLRIVKEKEDAKHVYKYLKKRICMYNLGSEDRVC